MVWEQKQHLRELCCGGKRHRQEQKEGRDGGWTLATDGGMAGVAREVRKGQMRKTT